MITFIQSIQLGIRFFPVIALLFTLPILMVTVMKYKTINLMRIGINYALILYLTCLVAVVIFPLPTLDQAAALSTYDIQLKPFQFVLDIIKESPFVLNKPSTLITAIFHQSVLQVVLNIIMTIPFGMFLKYYYGYNVKKILAFTFLLSFIIELTQLTGIFGIYSGSYRLCDVDDLMANTLGGGLGYLIMNVMSKVIPKIQKFDISIRRPRTIVS